jgi:hypothetical protein
MNVDDLKTAFYTVIFTTVVAEKLEGFSRENGDIS